ncbi:P-loop containing nucleoside triphosphate hydrolase [Phytophthora cactorum]|nr:P-loop containing nucleoside triphosphate hydrolase [Phytophthora cactorum]
MPSNQRRRCVKFTKVNNLLSSLTTLIVLGDSGVGKSSLVRRMTNSDSLSTNTGIHKTTCREWRSWKVPCTGESAAVGYCRAREIRCCSTAELLLSSCRCRAGCIRRHNRQSFIGVLRWVLQLQTTEVLQRQTLTFPSYLLDTNATSQMQHDKLMKTKDAISQKSSQLFTFSSALPKMAPMFDAIASALANGTSALPNCATTIENTRIIQPCSSEQWSRHFFANFIDHRCPQSNFKTLSAKTRILQRRQAYIGARWFSSGLTMTLWTEAMGI